MPKSRGQRTKESEPLVLQRSRTSRAAVVVVLIALSVIPYIHGISNEFLNWDDNHYVTNNQAVKWLNWTAVSHILTKPYYTDYSPVFLVSLGLQYNMFEENALGFKIASVVMHAISVFLVLVLLLRLTSSETTALVGAAVFAVHPAQVETISWVTEQKNLISMIFMLLSLLAYIRSYDDGKRFRLCYAIALVAAIMAYFSKPSTIILPLLLVVYHVCFRNCSLKTLTLRILPFAIFALIATILGINAQHRGEAVASWHGGTLYTNLLSIIPLGLGYLKIFILPHNLCALRANVVHTSLEGPVIAGIVFLIVSVAIAVYCWRVSRTAFFWLVWIPITLLPVSNLIPMRTMLSERYMHLPLVGFAAVTGLIIERCIRGGSRFARKALIVVLCAMLVLLASLSWSRAPVWRDSLTLWRDTVLHEPNVATSRLNLGFTHIDQDRLEKGLEIIDRAPLRTNDDYARRHNAIGELRLHQGRLDEAMDLFRRAIEIDPKNGRAWFLVGMVNVRAGRKQDAIGALRQSARHRPSMAEARSVLGTLLMESGQLEEAERELRAAIRYGFLPYKTYHNLGTLYAKMNRLAEARKAYRQVLRTSPPDFSFRQEVMEKLQNIERRLQQ